MHRDIWGVQHTKEGYEELYQLFKEEGSLNLDWFTWQIDDDRHMTKEQAFDLLNFFINRYSEDKKQLTLDFTEKEEEINTTTEVIKFECTPSNFGSQILAFNNDEIDVILRNQKKGSRSHNDTNKTANYEITIKKI